MLSLSLCHFNVTRSEFVKKQKVSVNETCIFDIENLKIFAYVVAYYKILHSIIFFFQGARAPSGAGTPHN
jgi:hypothetical protein